MNIVHEYTQKRENRKLTTADYWSNFRFRQGVTLFNSNTLVRGEPLNSRRWNLASKNTKHSSVAALWRQKTRWPYDRAVGSRTLTRVGLHLSRHTGFMPPQQGCRGSQCSCERGGREKEVKVQQYVSTVRLHAHCSGDWRLLELSESRHWISFRNWDAASPARLLSHAHSRSWCSVSALLCSVGTPSASPALHRHS